MVRIAAEAAMLSDSGETSYSNRNVCFDLRRRSRENQRAWPLADMRAILPGDDERAIPANKDEERIATAPLGPRNDGGTGVVRFGGES